MYLYCKDKTLLSFKYNVLNRNIVTNRTLNLWDRTKPLEARRSELCSFCKDLPETIEHLFYDCPVVKNFWDDILGWIWEKNRINIDFKKEQVLLGTAPKELEIFNLVFLVGMKHIYYSRLKDKTPQITVFKYLLSLQYESQKLIASNCPKKLLTFRLFWVTIESCFNNNASTMVMSQ